MKIGRSFFVTSAHHPTGLEKPGVPMSIDVLFLQEVTNQVYTLAGYVDQKGKLAIQEWLRWNLTWVGDDSPAQSCITVSIALCQEVDVISSDRTRVNSSQQYMGYTFDER